MEMENGSFLSINLCCSFTIVVFYEESIKGNYRVIYPP